MDIKFQDAEQTCHTAMEGVHSWKACCLATGAQRPPKKTAAYTEMNYFGCFHGISSRVTIQRWHSDVPATSAFLKHDTPGIECNPNTDRPSALNVRLNVFSHLVIFVSY